MNDKTIKHIPYWKLRQQWERQRKTSDRIAAAIIYAVIVFTLAIGILQLGGR